MSNVQLGYTQVIDPISFKSIPSGKIYIGEYGTLPNPANAGTWKQAYFVQDDGSRVAASQPIRTNAAGFAVDGSGNIRMVQVDGQYSLIVQDGFSAQKYSNTRVNEYSTSIPLSVDAITAIDATGLPDGITIVANGRDAAGDGGGGVFRYSAGSVHTADGGLVFAPATGLGRLFRDGWTMLGYNGEVNLRWFGAINDGVTDATNAITSAVNAVRLLGGGDLYAPMGDYLISSAIDLYQGDAKPIKIRGDGKLATKFITTSNIVVFQHAERCVFEAFTVMQNGTAMTGRAFSTPTTQQAAFCVWDRISIYGFKYGVWWRYSLWNSMRDCQLYDCAVGVKLSRNALPDDQTNPAAPGSWNITGGFFHNQNTFDNILCDGGEVGIWGTANGCTFINITSQNQSGDGSNNVAAPAGTQGTGIWLQNGSGTTRAGAESNILLGTMYFEGTKQPMVFDYASLSIAGFFAQGSGSSGTPYEQVIKATGARIDGRNCVPTGFDYFKYQIVAVDSTLLGRVRAGVSTISDINFSNSKLYESGIEAAATNTQIIITGASTTTVAVGENRNTYTVVVGGIYDGVTAVSAQFEVAFHQSGVTRVMAHPSNTAHITCTVSGSNIQINTTNPLAYNLRVTAIKNRALGDYPYSG